MFGAKYSRLIFWSISISLFILLAFVNFFAKLFTDIGQSNNSNFLYLIAFIISSIWLNTLANRIRDYGSNPWISLFALMPLVNFGLALYYGVVNKNSNPKLENISNSSDSTSLSKAVYNHTKDVVSEIKPTIDEYKQNHSTSKIETQISSNLNFDIDEDEIYEKIMIEIEENKKVKSTWGKALAQSDGNKDKAESLYIRIRLNEIKKNNIKNIKLEDSIIFANKKEENIFNEINREELDWYTYINTVSYNELDELYNEAKMIVLSDRKTSISHIQKKLRIGNARATKIIEQLEKTGIISKADENGNRTIQI